MERVENMCKDDFYLKSGALFVMIVYVFCIMFVDGVAVLIITECGIIVTCF